MTELGIPIPTKPNGVYCAGCGETGRHAPDCPSRLPACRTPMADGDRCRNCGWLLVDHPQMAGEVEALQNHIGRLEKRLAAKFASLDDFVLKTTEAMKAELEWVRDVERRLSDLEGARKAPENE